MTSSLVLLQTQSKIQRKGFPQLNHSGIFKRQAVQCVCVCVCFLLCWSTTETGHLHTNLEQELLDGIKVEACGKNMHKTGVIAETLRIWQS